MRAINFRNAYEFDPESYAEGGGLPGLLGQAMQQQSAQQQPDWIRQPLTADAIRQGAETLTGKFYQPKSRTGRYVETIGEFLPAILGGAGLAVRGGGLAAAAALRELPKTIVKHATAPGIVVQGLEDAYPESQAGSLLQKAYPAARSILPLALGAKRYFRP